MPVLICDAQQGGITFYRPSQLLADGKDFCPLLSSVAASSTLPPLSPKGRRDRKKYGSAPSDVGRNFLRKIAFPPSASSSSAFLHRREGGSRLRLISLRKERGCLWRRMREDNKEKAAKRTNTPKFVFPPLCVLLLSTFSYSPCSLLLLHFSPQIQKIGEM